MREPHAERKAATKVHSLTLLVRSHNFCYCCLVESTSSFIFLVTTTTTTTSGYITETTSSFCLVASTRDLNYLATIMAILSMLCHFLISKFDEFLHENGAHFFS